MKNIYKAWGKRDGRTKNETACKINRAVREHDRHTSSDDKQFDVRKSSVVGMRVKDSR